MLSQLAYNNFSGFVSAMPVFAVTLRELMDREGLPSLYEATRVPEQNRRLLYACADSPRYAEISPGFFRADLDQGEEKQFSAVTFRLSEKLGYVAFRGTDASIVGWKEDLSMAYTAPIPSQLEAVRYLRELSAALPEWRFILGGHSKGGNLAEYAAACIDEETKERILAVYNHDGPGFLPGAMDMTNFDTIRARIHKTVPESSVIGPLLEQHSGFRVVQSSAFLYLQHDPFSWLIENGDFLYSPSVSGFSRRANSAIVRWLADTDDETRQVFIEALYDALSPAREEEGGELRNMGLIKNAPLIISGIKTENPEVRRRVAATMNSLVLAVADELRQAFAEKRRKIITQGRRVLPWGDSSDSR